MAATVFYSPLTVFRFVVCHWFAYGLYCDLRIIVTYVLPEDV